MIKKVEHVKTLSILRRKSQSQLRAYPPPTFSASPISLPSLVRRYDQFQSF